ncbi:MAG: hypothetical protein WCF18_19015 [Chthoniobacteraceae bacterium]
MRKEFASSTFDFGLNSSLEELEAQPAFSARLQSFSCAGFSRFGDSRL